MNVFADDNAWQRDMRDRVLAPGFYGAYAMNGRYVFMDKGRFATMLQKRFAVDTIVQGKDGAAICIEEKIVRWPASNRAHTSFFLETQSCTVPGHESSGWMTYAEADYLLYCYAQPNDDLDCYLIDFQKLQEWFWKHEGEFRRSVMPAQNKTAGRIVPIETVRVNVPLWRRLVLNPANAEAAA